jgi:hypothetical protein
MIRHLRAGWGWSVAELVGKSRVGPVVLGHGDLLGALGGRGRGLGCCWSGGGAWGELVLSTVAELLG